MSIKIAKEDLVEYVKIKMSSSDISKKTGINPRTIRWYMKKYNITPTVLGGAKKVWNKGLTALDDNRILKAVTLAHNARRGQKSWNNKGGFVNGYGYKIIYVNGKRKREHIFLIEESIGRALNSNECVHHKDGNKLNNQIKNLELLTKKEHAKLHYPKGSYFGKNKAIATW